LSPFCVLYPISIGRAEKKGSISPRPDEINLAGAGVKLKLRKS
jgi:hypothetical protein